MEHNRYIRLIEDATGSGFRPGNQFKLLQNGDEIFPAMLEAIARAQTSIEFSTYVYWRSRIASQFADALCERARAGVQVRLLVDAVGGAIMNSRTVWQMEQAGVHMAWFRPVRWPYLRKLNNRTHRKILIADSRIGFTGGVGIADEWTGAAGDAHHWRETHCRIEGPACADLLAGFAENWREATGERLNRPAPGTTKGGLAIHTTASAAGPRPTKIEQLVATVITAATRRLWVATAYFVPSPGIMQALITAAGRGVDVRILTNGALTNHQITRQAGRASYQELLEGGVKIYEYQATVLHAKVITADQSWATIGSANLDDRSLVLNDELNICLTDSSIVAELDAQFLADLKLARQIDPAHWHARSWINRTAEAGSSLFRHQL